MTVIYFTAERNYHITTHGSYWQDPNFESGHEDEETVGVLQEGPNRPRLEGYPNFDDWELDLRSSVRIARRSAVCVVDDPNDPHHISLYHTFQNSMDARDDNELSSLKLPHDDVNLSMVKRLIDYYPQSVIINELARESEEEKTNLVHELFDNGVIIVTSLWQQHLFGENEEESVEMEEEDEESDSNQSIDFGEEYGSPGVEKVDLDEDDDSTADINDL
ncbi:unnamed protein product [Rodentolepis nana]|uniref:Anaphase-promoting complex subunit 13 n=1 Tax=Rodentolepis nana TaxID=102285 RepID=A0A0R3TXE4_RODNA|nr:unnamed protein product [Rodentolepis nana]